MAEQPQENPYLKMMQETTPQQNAAPTPAAQTAPQPSTMQTLGQGALDFAKGVGKGALHTVSSTDEFARQHLPAFLTNSNMGFGPPANLEHVKQMATPHGTMQSIGHGVEQAGEFMIPGGAEEKLASMAPRVIQPLARIGTSALGAGMVNKAQGGSFGTGAAMGAAGSAVGQGLKAIAPSVAEKALGIRGKFDRAFNKAPGEAALSETTGIRPETISNQARERIGQLSGQTEKLAENASARPNPVRGLLPAPPEQIPLAPTPSPRNPKMRPIAFDAEVNPEEPMEPRSGNPMAPISEYPGINPHYLSGSAHPELSGRIPTTQGVLIRPQQASGAPLPSMVPNRAASLAPARGVVREAMGSAENQNAGGLHGQLGNMQDFLSRKFSTGEPIPENVTPRQLLYLRRGFNEEHGRWNPELRDAAVTTGRRAYGALTDEFHRVLPEAEPLDERVANLIPVKNRAQIKATGDNVSQKVLGRIGAHSGAALLGTAGAYEGRREGGVPGAIAGGITGVLAPELIASPEGQMLAARTLNRAGGLRGAVGAAAQLSKRKEDENQ